MSTLASSTGHEDPEQTLDPKRGQQVLNLMQDPQNPDNLKELKTMMGNRSWERLPRHTKGHPQGLSRYD